MIKFITSLYSKIKENSYFKTYMLILFPVLITLIYAAVIGYSYNKNNINLLKASYSSKLESICNENELSLQNITTMIHMLSENEDFMKISLAQKNIDKNTSVNVSNTLTQLIKKNTLIDSIFIYDRQNGRIYSNSGEHNPIDFFSSEYVYAEYSRFFWDNCRAYVSEKRIYLPSIVGAEGVKRLIIPIVYTQVGDTPIDNLIVVNVNLSAIIQNAEKSKLTPNSEFLVVNKQNRNIFNENNDYGSIENDLFFDYISADNIAVFDFVIRGKKNLVISYSLEDTILRHSYVTLVPYKDINSNMLKITYLFLALGIAIFLLIIAITYFSTKQIYKPIENLMLLFNDPKKTNDGKATDTLNQLRSSIQETLELNYSLSDEISKAIPLIQERSLINLLNSNEHYRQLDLDIPIDFKYEYFCSVVIRLNPTEEFYTLYNNIEYNAIKSGIRNIIQSAFGEKFDIYIIPSETDALYVLMNLPNDNQSQATIEILEEFKEAMIFDSDYMKLKIGVGGIYPNLEGLKKSHYEAINSVSSLIDMTHVKISVDKDEKQLDSYILNLNDENILLNHLILGRHFEAKQLFEDILAENVNKNISDTAIMQLYIQILNIVFKAMRMKGISYDTENNGDFHIIAEIIKQPLSTVHDTVLKYMDIIVSHTDYTGSKFEIQSIISYIENNYSQDLSLDYIADKFDTTPNYLSKLIKNKLGINFIDYITGLRVDKAKLLLLETNKNISEICAEVGFNNRSTFIRAFKKNTGLTPSKFRSEKK